MPVLSGSKQVLGAQLGAQLRALECKPNGINDLAREFDLLLRHRIEVIALVLMINSALQPSKYGIYSIYARNRGDLWLIMRLF